MNSIFKTAILDRLILRDNISLVNHIIVIETSDTIIIQNSLFENNNSRLGSLHFT